MRTVLILLVLIYWAAGKPLEADTRSEKKCGYQSCHKIHRTKLNVHLVPHSHDDVGWLKTVDQYFFGSKTNIQMAGIQYIIGSSIDALRSNPDRRFIQVETAFFWKWWKQQSEQVRDDVRYLVNNGRLEIINGAWSMNDEAATHYHSIIDQFTLGLRTINDTLGECGQPKIGWQIDPFGHSREMASIFSQLGFEGQFFARLDYRDSKLRHNRSELEMVWQGSPSLGKSSNLFTGVLYDFYTTPAYFCWDVLCSDVPINNDEESPDYNELDIVNRFADYVLKGSKYFNTNNLLVTMGGDFTYQAAEMFFNNMDKLIQGFRKFRPDINIIYSTPSCYLKAVNEISKGNGIKYTVKTDDFFPYASKTYSYWTGYFTSRPNSKRFERQGNNILQVTKQLVTFEKLLNGKDYSKNLTLLKEAMGIMQHHDAITGTEKQHVVGDYVRLLEKGIKAAETNVGSIIHDLLSKDGTSGNLKIKLESCLLSNVSYCHPSKADQFTVAVYNPLSRNASHYVRLPVDKTRFQITGSNGDDIPYTIMPAIANFTDFADSSPSDLVFLADDIPPLGLKYFHLKVQHTRDIPKIKEVVQHRLGDEVSGFTIDDVTGLLQTVTLNGVTLKVKQEFMYYHGANGSNLGEENQASGAYIFRPADSTRTAVSFADKVTFTVHSSEFVDEVHQTINSWIKQVIRLYKQENYIEFDWVVGPIDISTNSGTEVISRFTADVDSNGTFYTDSNGRQMLRRVRDYRETYDYTDEEPVSGNYYPITSRITLRDHSRNLEIAVLNDRAQGGSSLHDGQMELMVHRRLLNDDDFGVQEALNEVEFDKGVIARGQHFLTFGPIKSDDSKTSSALQRDLAQKKILNAWVFVGNATGDEFSYENLKEKINFQFSGLRRSLPPNVQILTLEPADDRSILLRLEHVFEEGEDDVLSKPVAVDIADLFTLFNIESIRETTLGANQWLDDNEKLEWDLHEYSDGRASVNYIEESRVGSSLDDFVVTLTPMKIRTFIIYV
ncbi:PREDICTED: lysosomal alpha-mannosidase-like [Nicrophorus vespilloides]|uniref:Alpha-mannosidase n=1 Tax=Nicrophorus vespilloides TaxID=110193 RepID=A0ABM1M5W9_NICVS|nr:PREDICTED: lysosomal alpha-mannosidase-like [Nicrophorus vespilloides]